MTGFQMPVTALWWLIPTALTSVYIRRPYKAIRDSLNAIGCSCLAIHAEVVISRRLVLRFAALWLAVVMVSFGITVYILPYGVGLFAGAAVLTIAGILPIVPRWFG